jgi:hypothetical protein
VVRAALPGAAGAAAKDCGVQGGDEPGDMSALQSRPGGPSVRVMP